MPNWQLNGRLCDIQDILNLTLKNLRVRFYISLSTFEFTFWALLIAWLAYLKMTAYCCRQFSTQSPRHLYQMQTRTGFQNCMNLSLLPRRQPLRQPINWRTMPIKVATTGSPTRPAFLMAPTLPGTMANQSRRRWGRLRLETPVGARPSAMLTQNAMLGLSTKETAGVHSKEEIRLKGKRMKDLCQGQKPVDFKERQDEQKWNKQWMQIQIASPSS